MDVLPKPSPGRTPMVLMLVVLLATVCAVVYLFLDRILRPVNLGAEDSGLAVRSKLTLLLGVVLGATLLILVFVLGSYLVMRAGRALSQKPLGGKPTTYVDAWSHYRLTDADIKAATREDQRHGKPPDDPNGPPAEPHTGDSPHPEPPA